MEIMKECFLSQREAIFMEDDLGVTIFPRHLLSVIVHIMSCVLFGIPKLWQLNLLWRAWILPRSNASLIIV